MALFQKSVLVKHLKTLDEKIIKEKYQLFQNYFLHPTIQANIRQSKEEQYQATFLNELFVKILGYTLNPNPDFNLTTEYKNVKDAKKADGAILQAEKAIAVIELKGTNTTDLGKVEKQAFGYKNNQPDAIYVITSNFEKLRFYIDNAVEYVEFNLFYLSYEDFKLLYLCLAKDNIYKNLAKQVKDNSLVEEEEVTKKLYKDYSSFRRDLFNDLVKGNPEIDQLVLFKKTQKLLDRFLFIFFAEDGGLLPPNSIAAIIKQWVTLRDELDAYTPLYDRFKKYFGYMNTGHKGTKHDIFAYNGGLFKPDDLLDNVKIDDTLLYKHTQNLSAYDFKSEVDVNILGHIFEHSLNEIEELQSEIAGNVLDKSKTRRKKDGVFYTPKYITKYIVENTVGKLCEEKKEELGLDEEEFSKSRKGRKKAVLKKLVQQLEDYRNWLLQVTICDPACGSGAFLNQALEFLIKEHSYIDELQTKLLGGGFVFPNVENAILENNLFGVDINEESVEIAKLSLWLRSAQPNRKLTSLNSNIKCGNSLIDDPEVAGDKAFSWEKEFPTVFESKDKQAYHVVLTTHNSRTSARMKKMGVEKGEPVLLGLEEEIALTEIIGNIIKENDYQCLAYNICKDHVHLVLVCEYEELTGMVQKIKSISSKLFHRLDIPMGHDPLEHGNHLWSQKFFRVDLDVWELATLSKKTGYVQNSNHLGNAINYIIHNREKHELPASKKLEKIIHSFIAEDEIAFALEYKGGFDVVVGNPPYVNLESIKEISRAIEQANYKTYNKRGDLYCVFVEKGFNILNTNGAFSFIMPNKWLQAGYGKDLREYFLSKQLDTLIDFGDIQIFKGATTYPCIFVSRNAKPTDEFNVSVLQSANSSDFETNVEISSESFKTADFSGDTWVISSKKENELLTRLNGNSTKLKNYVNGNANYGIKTGLTAAFLISEETKNQIVKEDIKSEEIIKPVLRGRDISPWIGQSGSIFWITTFPSLNIDIDEYPSVKKHLLSFGKERLEQSGKKGSRKKTNNKWFETQDSISYWNDFFKPKIMYQKFQVKPCFIYDEQGLYCNDSMWIIPTNNKGLLAVLNSKMGWWLITKYCTQIQNGCQLIWKYFSQIPIPEINNELTVLAERTIEFHQSLNQKKSRFLNRLQSNLSPALSPPRGHDPLKERKDPLEERKDPLEERKNPMEIKEETTEPVSVESPQWKPSKKIESFYDHDFKTLVSELKKKKIKLSLVEQDEWEEYFNAYKTDINDLQAEIAKTDKEIDQMVYELYGLTEEEIAIVENS